MNRQQIMEKYKLDQLENILSEIENVITNTLNQQNVKASNDKRNFLLYTLGKSILTMRETIILCWSGYPDGALSLSRNLFEQFIHVTYIGNCKDIDSVLNKYNDDYAVQRTKALKFHAEYILKSTQKVQQYKTQLQTVKEKYNVKKMNDYWWAGVNNFSDMCEKVAKQSGELEFWIREMQLIYKRACLSLHSSCMGNKVRLGSNLADIDMGPWNNGQEVPLFLASSSLMFITCAVYDEMNIDHKEITDKWWEYVKYYFEIVGKSSSNT